MIDYRMMDENCLLTSCLHKGPISFSACSKYAWAELKYGLPEGCIARFLRAVCRAYGSCGVIAVDKDLIVAKIRFCPQSLMDILPEEALCVQNEDGTRRITSFDSNTLPQKNALTSKDLFVLCFQTAPSYRGQGIATAMLKTLIEWAKANGWENIRAKAIQHIPHLLQWTGMWSVEQYRRLGFQVTGSALSEELMEAVIAMRQGRHGEEVKNQWEQYGHLCDEEASRLYDVVLSI